MRCNFFKQSFISNQIDIFLIDLLYARLSTLHVPNSQQMIDDLHFLSHQMNGPADGIDNSLVYTCMQGLLLRLTSCWPCPSSWCWPGPRGKHGKSNHTWVCHVWFSMPKLWLALVVNKPFSFDFIDRFFKDLLKLIRI